MKTALYLKTPVPRLAWQLAGLSIVLFAASLVFRAAPAHAAACAAPSTDYGSVTSSVSISTTGTYRVWSRIMAPDSTNNSYLLEIDGNSCYTVGDSSITANTWTWVDYQNGTTSSKINASLSAGTHTVKMIGNAPDVKLDRVVFTTDTACVPTGNGDNCASGIDGTNPVATLNTPVNNATLTGTVNLTATASDNVGVTKVEFYQGFTLIGTDTTSPYSFAWNTTSVPDGSYPVFAKAYDAAGNTDDSTVINVTVDNTAPNAPPVTSLTAPADNAFIKGTIPISATATDDKGISKVEFYWYIGLIGTDTTSPYGVNWNTTTMADGTYAIFSKAYDADGAQTDSAVRNITVDNTPPTTSITAPVIGNVLSGTTTISAAANDAIGVTKTELYIDGNLAATDVATPFSFSWNTVNASQGSHILTTKAYDAAGNVTTSSPVTVTVDNPVATPVPGDANGDNHVTVVDLSILLSNFSKTGTRSTGDMNSDGLINILDLSILLSNFGR